MPRSSDQVTEHRAEVSRRSDLLVEYVPLSGIKAYAKNARRHSRKQVTQIAASIRRFGFNNPVLVAADGTIIAGHARAKAARQLGLDTLPIVRLGHLSDAERRAYVIADNRLAELSSWSIELLEEEVQGLAALDLDFPLEITGFEGAQLEQLTDPASARRDDAADRCPEPEERAISRVGDAWKLGEHRLVCGDALNPEVYAALMNGEKARMMFSDPPYNVPINGHAGGLGRRARREFVQASGEMSSEEFASFLNKALQCAAEASMEGAIHFCCTDWRHLGELSEAVKDVYSEQKNLIVWIKSNGGMGTFYRSRHELIGVYKVGTAPHVNTFGLGETGRCRTNAWEYPGVNSFGRGRDEALDMHPTVKPVAMVADAIRDVSHRGDLVLDPFGGSGTTLIAAEKTKRRGRLIELDPRYCDVICRRWASFKGAPALLEASGDAFDAVAAARDLEAAS